MENRKVILERRIKILKLCKEECKRDKRIVDFLEKWQEEIGNNPLFDEEQSNT